MSSLSEYSAALVDRSWHEVLGAKFAVVFRARAKLGYVVRMSKLKLLRMLSYTRRYTNQVCWGGGGMFI